MAAEGRSGGRSMPSPGDAAPRTREAPEGTVPPASKKGKDKAYRDRMKEKKKEEGAEMERLRVENYQLRSDLQRVTDEKKNAVNELALVRKDKELSDYKNESLQKELQVANQTLQSANRREQDFSSQLQSVNQRVEDLSGQLQSVNQRVEDLSGQVLSGFAQLQHLIQGSGIPISRCKHGQSCLTLQHPKTFLSLSPCREFQCGEIFTSPNSSSSGETFLNFFSSKLRFTNRGNKKALIRRTPTNTEVNRMLTVPIETSGTTSSLQCVLNSISSSNIPFPRNTATEMDAEKKLSVRKAILPSHLHFSISQMSILQGYFETPRNRGDIWVVSASSVRNSPCSRVIPNLVISRCVAPYDMPNQGRGKEEGTQSQPQQLDKPARSSAQRKRGASELREGQLNKKRMADQRSKAKLEELNSRIPQLEDEVREKDEPRETARLDLANKKSELKKLLDLANKNSELKKANSELKKANKKSELKKSKLKKANSELKKANSELKKANKKSELRKSEFKLWDLANKNSELKKANKANQKSELKKKPSQLDRENKLRQNALVSSAQKQDVQMKEALYGMEAEKGLQMTEALHPMEVENGLRKEEVVHRTQAEQGQEKEEALHWKEEALREFLFAPK